MSRSNAFLAAFFAAAALAGPARGQTATEPSYLDLRKARMLAAWSDFTTKQSPKIPSELLGLNQGIVLPTPLDYPPGAKWTRITIDFSGSPPDAVAKLSAIGGLPIITSPPTLLTHGTWPAVKLQGTDRPLVDLLMQLCSQAGLQWTKPKGDNNNRSLTAMVRPIQLAAISNGHAIGPWSACGPFVFYVTQMTATATFNQDLDAPAPLQITIWGAREPDVNLVLESDHLDLDEAVDELGHSLVPAVPPARRGGPVGPSELLLNLSIPRGAGRLIHRLRAHYECTIGGGADGAGESRVLIPIEFDDLPLP